MKRLMGLVLIAVCVLPQVVRAEGDYDHVQLKQLAARLGAQASRLYDGARRVIGVYPLQSQKYAFEHVSFFHNSAHRFEHVVQSAVVEDLERDHTAIGTAYRKLEHDVFYARQTFEDLFLDRDHVVHAQLDALLSDCEALVRQIGNDLP